MILLDTNVLIRAFLPNAEKERFLAALTEVECSSLRPMLLGGQVRELYAVLTRSASKGGFGLSPADAIKSIKDIRSDVPLLEDDRIWLETWIVLVVASGTRDLHSHDAYLAAACLSLRCPVLTADTGFRRYPGLDLRLVP